MLIAVTGKKSHGKTTAARVLERQGFAHLNFADPVKEVAQLVYHLTDAEINDPILKETMLTRWPFKTPRDILQQVGTEMFRNYVSDTWTENHRLRSAEHSKVVASDLRFLNEEAAVRKRGGFIVKVVDPRKPVNDKDLSTRHKSELELDFIQPDIIIENDSSINELQAEMMDFYDKVRRARDWAEREAVR